MLFMSNQRIVKPKLLEVQSLNIFSLRKGNLDNSGGFFGGEFVLFFNKWGKMLGYKHSRFETLSFHYYGSPVKKCFLYYFITFVP